MNIQLPCNIDVRNASNKAELERLVGMFGKSQSVNEIGETYHCQTEQGQRFDVFRFWSSRHIWRISNESV